MYWMYAEPILMVPIAAIVPASIDASRAAVKLSNLKTCCGDPSTSLRMGIELVKLAPLVS